MRYNCPIIPADSPVTSRQELMRRYKEFCSREEKRLLLLHRQTDDGMKVCQERTLYIDHILKCLFTDLPPLLDSPQAKAPDLALVASGGYARGVMNRHSDIDLTLFASGNTLRVTNQLTAFVREFLFFLDELRFEVGHATDSVGGRLDFANHDNPTKTTLITTRLVAGSEKIYEEFQKRFKKKCIVGKENAFIEIQLQELAERHARHEGTPFVQHPNVKEGCGGLRDYQNLLWVTFAKLGTTDLKDLVAHGILDKRGWNELSRAYDFLLRVRNELHYHEKRAQDILHMRLQGIVATKLGYKGKHITDRIEAFMHDYYIHVRNVLRQSSKVMDRFNIEVLEQGEQVGVGLKGVVLRSLRLGRKKGSAREEHFDGFYSKYDRIFAEDPNIFKKDPSRLMRLFQYTQQRNLRLSPDLFDMVCNTGAVNAEFRYHKTQREVFMDIIERKGEVGRVLRQMHRCDFLGKYIPEFGTLTCRLTHEHFHTYAGDEHTLRCIDHLDELAGTEVKGLEFYQRIFRELHDPAVLYLAMLLHDTGRTSKSTAHAEESAVLADKVCRRLHISGERRARLIFLVDSHLEMFLTATKKDPDDPNVVREFANIVKTRENLDSLTVMTMADSKGVGPVGWSSYKDASLRELYHNTVRYLASPADFMERATISLDELKAAVKKELGKDSHQVVDEHFERMPRAYFNFRKPATIAKHLRQFRLHHQSETPDVPVFGWEDKPNEGCSKFVVAGRDRRMILARCAGALAAENLSIIAADLYRRTDDLILDVFRVTTHNFTPVTHEATKRRVQAALEESFSTEDFHFSAKINTIRQTQKTDAAIAEGIPQWVYINNRISAENTVVELQAIDRIGLLYDLFRAIAHAGVNVTHARISTERGVAVDSIYVQTADRQKVTDPQVLSTLASLIESDVLKR